MPSNKGEPGGSTCCCVSACQRRQRVLRPLRRHVFSCSLHLPPVSATMQAQGPVCRSAGVHLAGCKWGPGLKEPAHIHEGHARGEQRLQTMFQACWQAAATNRCCYFHAICLQVVEQVLCALSWKPRRHAARRYTRQTGRHVYSSCSSAAWSAGSAKSFRRYQLRAGMSDVAAGLTSMAALQQAITDHTTKEVHSFVIPHQKAKSSLPHCRLA